MFSNIEIKGILVHGKRDTGAKINAMPLNIYDQLNMKLNGDLQLKPCNDVKIVGYTKQSVSNVGQIAMTCTHANVMKKCLFYVTDITGTKVILGLNFCTAFNLVKIICDEKYACKQVTIDVINDFPKGLDVPDVSSTKVLPPVDVHLKLQPDCTNHILELHPDLFDGFGTIKHAMVKLDIDQAAIPVVQPPKKVPQAMTEPLKKKIERMEHLKVIHKLDMNEATDWCHNLVLVCKPNGNRHVCLDHRTINNALRFNVHNSRTFQDITSSIRHVAKVSKIDANSGFWTLPMDANSQLLTTFNTPWGRYCFTKMPFGLNQAQYFFQFYMDQNFRDINPTTNLITDDVMMHGEN